MKFLKSIVKSTIIRFKIWSFDKTFLINVVYVCFLWKKLSKDWCHILNQIYVKKRYLKKNYDGFKNRFFLETRLSIPRWQKLSFFGFSMKFCLENLSDKLKKVYSIGYFDQHTKNGLKSSFLNFICRFICPKWWEIIFLHDFEMKFF